MKVNRILLLAVAALLLLSAWTYRESVTRAERFERGQKFLSNLNPDEIAEIEITDGEQTTHLRRGEDRFVLVSSNGYRARNEAVNRFLRDVLELELEKEVGGGESLAEELAVAGPGEETRQVVLENAAGNVMVSFLIGKAREDGGGSYVRRTDGGDDTIYLTTQQVYLSTGEADFIDQEILDVQSSEVSAVRGADYAIEKIDGELQLLDLPAGKKENASKMSQAKSMLSYLRFEQHHLADAPEVEGLYFRDAVSVELGDETGYDLAVASLDGKHYLRVQGYSNVTEVMVSPDDDEETAKEKSEILLRADQIVDFNAHHGSWVYEVSEATAEKVRLRKDDLIEDA